MIGWQEYLKTEIVIRQNRIASMSDCLPPLNKFLSLVFYGDIDIDKIYVRISYYLTPISD